MKKQARVASKNVVQPVRAVRAKKAVAVGHHIKDRKSAVAQKARKQMTEGTAKAVPLQSGSGKGGGEVETPTPDPRLIHVVVALVPAVGEVEPTAEQLTLAQAMQNLVEGVVSQQQAQKGGKAGQKP
jgi:hypothetical protein